MENKKSNSTFEAPKAEVVLFDNEDVLTTSGGAGSLPGTNMPNEGPVVPAPSSFVNTNFPD